MAFNIDYNQLLTSYSAITEKDQGHKSKPTAYKNVPDTQFADPVNHKYPIDEEHVIAALSITIPHLKMPDLEMSKLIQLVQSCAKELTDRMSRVHS